MTANFFQPPYPAEHLPVHPAKGVEVEQEDQGPLLGEKMELDLLL